MRVISVWLFSAWGSGGKDNIGSAVPMFAAGPEEPPWPVVAARDGWFVVFMIGAGADGTLDSRCCRNS